MKTKILFVCMGNICRSPAAEGVARLLNSQNFEIDSAGTGSWHVGQAPDSRMRKVAAKHGFPIDDLRARVVTPDDFYEFDWIIALDQENLSDLNSIKPAGSKAKLKRLLDFGNQGIQNVPDPYYGGLDDFENSFKIIQQGVEDLFSVL